MHLSKSYMTGSHTSTWSIALAWFNTSEFKQEITGTQPLSAGGSNTGQRQRHFTAYLLIHWHAQAIVLDITTRWNWKMPSLLLTLIDSLSILMSPLTCYSLSGIPGIPETLTIENTGYTGNTYHWEYRIHRKHLPLSRPSWLTPCYVALDNLVVCRGET